MKILPFTLWTYQVAIYGRLLYSSLPLVPVEGFYDAAQEPGVYIRDDMRREDAV